MIPGLYDIEMISKSILEDAVSKRQDPHVYTVGERAYCDMMQKQRDQSMIVSGESGAGKTEACKRVMTYLAKISNTVQDVRNADTGVESKGDEEDMEVKVRGCSRGVRVHFCTCARHGLQHRPGARPSPGLVVVATHSPVLMLFPDLVSHASPSTHASLVPFPRPSYPPPSHPLPT